MKVDRTINNRTGNKDLIKDINIYHCINAIRSHDLISRAEISKEIGLAQSTITKIINPLIEDGLILEVGDGTSTGGRKPINLKFNNDFGFILSVKIEASKLIIALCNLEPSIISTSVTDFKIGTSYEELLPILIKELHLMNQDRVFAIGITISGIVDDDKGMLISSTLLGWSNIHLCDDLKKEFGVVIFIENDVNAFAVYQLNSEFGKGHNSFVCMTVGEGVGSGIIINGKLYKGEFGGAGEIGHQILFPGGKKCYCGQHGCLEMYVNEDEVLHRIEQKIGQTVTYNQVFRENVVDKKIVDETMLEVYNFVGIAVINLIMQMNPQRIIIGVKKEVDTELLETYLKEIIRENWFYKKAKMETEICFTVLVNEKFVIGMAQIVTNEIVNNSILLGEFNSVFGD
ncbi:MAG: ROK family transcriptional regulator [Erysipelotrichaceae bacterium]|nr:ROK family transcriptional regulator [Erysipelotrichaceae bacterium]